MSHHDKFWEKFGQKIRQYQPTASTGSDWQAMEQLLDKPARPANKINGRLLALILVAMAGGYLAGAWYGFPSIPDQLGAFPIPMAGIAQMKKTTPDQAGSPDPSAIDDEDTAKHEAVVGALSRRIEDTKKRKPGAYPPVPGNLASTHNRRDVSAIETSTLLGEEGHLEEPIGSITESLEAVDGKSHITTSVFFNDEVLSSLPVVSGNVVTHQAGLASAEYPATPERRHRRMYGGFLLGSNLSIPGDGSSSLYPFGGIFGGLQITPRWAVQVEAHVKYVDNLSVAYERTVQLETNNGYSFDQASSGVIEKSYLALEMPLVAKYKVSPTWSILAGVRPALIIDTPSSFLGQNRQEASFTAQNGSGQSRSDVSSEPELRKFDVGVSVALEWAFHRRWSLDARFSRGLLGLASNQVFQSDNQHFNSGFQLSVRRKF